VLRAEGDGRELQRAIQDLRREAGLDLDARIELWLAGVPDDVAPLLAGVARETLAEEMHRGRPDGETGHSVTVELAAAPVTIWLRAAQDARRVE
jgi:hypothetical protein